MSVDRKVVSRRFIVNSLGALTLGGLGLYTLSSSENPPSMPVQATSGLPSTPGATFIAEATHTATIERAQSAPTLVQPIDNHYRGTAGRIAGTQEFYGTFPTDRFAFSDEIVKAALVPHVFINETTDQRVRKSAAYFARFAMYLKNNSQYDSRSLNSLAINTGDNFPIAFGIDARLSDVLEDFDRSIIVRNMRIDTDPVIGANYHLGTYGAPEFKDGKWSAASLMRLNTIVTDEKAALEDHGTAYYQTTDLQLGLKLMHEFGHYKQIEALMADILRDTRALSEIGQDPGRMSEAITLRADFHKARMARSLGLEPSAFAPNEAQANTLSQLALHTLSTINRTDRFPGAEDDDPYPVREDSLLRKFRKGVLGNHALDKQWQLAHNW